jgi:hypothetical protein
LLILAPMPRFYFDLHNDVDAIDREGKELGDLVEARKIALKAAREMIAASAEEGHINLNHFIQVREESGKIADRITFGEAISIVPQH